MARTGQKLKRLQIERELAYANSTSFDPVEPRAFQPGNERQDWVGFASRTAAKVEQGIYDFAPSIVPAVLSASPVGTAVLYTATVGQIFEEIMRENPDVNPQAALGFALAMGAVDTGLNRVKWEVFVQKAPGIRKIKGVLWRSQIPKYFKAPIRAGVVLGGEYLTENVQNLIDIAGRQTFEELAPGMKNVPLSDAINELLANQERIIFAVMPFAGLAAGHMALTDGRDFRAHLRDPKELSYLGLAPEQIARITAERDPKRALAILREEYAKLTPDQVQKGIKALIDDTKLMAESGVDPEGIRFSKGESGADPAEVGRAMLSLGESQDTAKLGPTPVAKDLPSIIKTLAPEQARDIKVTPGAGIFGEGYSFNSPGGVIYLVKDNESTYHVNSAAAGEHRTEIYQSIYSWAHNNNKVIREDDVMLPAGIYRRTSQMLSSAIRYGTTRHMTVGGWSEIKGWRKGDSPQATEYNIGLLAAKERDIVMQRLRKRLDMRYDIETNAFYDGKYRIHDEEVTTYLQRSIKELDPDFSDRIGHATLRRALVVNALEGSGTRAQGWSLGGLSGENQSFEGIRYAKDSGGSEKLEADDPRGGGAEGPGGSQSATAFESGGSSQEERGGSFAPGGEPASVPGGAGPKGSRSESELAAKSADVSRVESLLRGVQKGWRSQLKTKVHASVDDIDNPKLRRGAQEEGNVEAFFDPSDRTIHIIADRVDGPVDAERLLRHEGIHWALQGPLRRRYLDILDATRKLIPEERWQELKRSYEGHSDRVLIEEYLAREGQNNPKSTLWRGFVYEVKSQLRKVFGDRVSFTDSDVLALLHKANRKLERGNILTETKDSAFDGNQIHYSKQRDPITETTGPLSPEVVANYLRGNPDHPTAVALRTWFEPTFRGIQDGKMPEQEALLNNLLNRLPGYKVNGSLYRGVPFYNEKERDAFLEKLKQPVWINDRRFMSASKADTIALNQAQDSSYPVFILIESSWSGRDIEPFGFVTRFGWQKEVLFRRGAKFNVTNRKQVDFNGKIIHSFRFKELQ